MSSSRSAFTDNHFEAVKEDVRNLKSDGQTLASDSASLARSMHSKATDTISGSLRRIEDSLSDIWDAITKTSTDSYKAVHANIEERPFTLLLAAFAAGTAAGWFFLDRKR
jgi:ElaB/YqjD/DUF883 family membrane-anchored ribosome-binding protein